MAKKIVVYFKRFLVAIALAGLVVWLFGGMVLRSWEAKPPKIPFDTSLFLQKPELRDGKMRLGQCWTSRREGLLVVYLKGSPFEIGYAQGVLMQDKMHVLENEFLEMIKGYVPQRRIRNLLKHYIIFRNRHLSDFVPLKYREEIYGTSLGCPDIHPEEGSFYNRLLNYHSAHDVSYMMIDNPLVSRAGCTAFGAWGGATEKGHLITGRNFDWEAAEVFSRDRVVMMCEPDDGIPFISLSWAGMAGVVSGMNRAGISITINGAPSSLPNQIATPAAMVAREILEKSHNLEEALRLLRDAKVFVSTLWLMGSRTDGKFVIVEKTPDTTQVRETSGDSIVCGNYFQTPGLKNDALNTNYIAEATSVSRELRMAELLASAPGHITVGAAVEFLRDRQLPGNHFPGNGHRSTLNAFIATHATVMNLTDGIFWAASPPHQLGKFVAFDVNAFDHELPALSVPPDALVTSGEYTHVQEAQKLLVEAKLALKLKDAASALVAADKAEATNPQFYQNASLRGKALEMLGRIEEATKAFDAALTQKPAFLSERRELEESIKRIRRGN